jgi:hypothetical protein
MNCPTHCHSFHLSSMPHRCWGYPQSRPRTCVKLEHTLRRCYVHRGPSAVQGNAHYGFRDHHHDLPRLWVCRLHCIRRTHPRIHHYESSGRLDVLRRQARIMLRSFLHVPRHDGPRLRRLGEKHGDKAVVPITSVAIAKVCPVCETSCG